MSLWGGRFKENIHPLVKEFTYSIQTDKRLYPYDIRGSIAHARMLAKCGIISEDEAEKIIESLRKIEQDIREGKIDFSEKEDIHMAIEEELIRREGELGEKLHTARSRNDQIALDERLYLREEITEIRQGIKNFQIVLLKIAGENTGVVIPGYTHLQYAQPVSFAHHMLAYFWMLQRDRERFRDCYQRVNVCPLGAGAIAGSSLPIKREYVAELLSFPEVTENSLDTVSDRDYIIEFLSCCSILIMHLSRLSEDLILWSSPLLSFVEVADVFATGSSLMPQKKNPDVAELTRGKVGKVYGALISALTMMKALPLSYNRDMQEDKPPLFQTIDEVRAVLKIFPEIVGSMRINADVMRKKASQGFFAATDLVDYLVQKGVAFRSAHRIVGKIVRYCVQEGRTFDELTLEEYGNFSPAFEEDVRERIDVRFCVENKESTGGTGKKSLRNQLRKAREKLEDGE